ncbi:MAG: Asp-tRNA(Asn)/Glu-tRNA(Gln) amidotransferase subunit GatB [Nitrospiraceae bacterium]
MTYEVVIGVEVHAQLRTQSKMFCACGTLFGLGANSQTCPVCLGMPGALPVLNQKAVEMAVRTGLALHCTIRSRNQFARKNYFYPDLPKGYQISQYEAPICEHGWIEIQVGTDRKRIRIHRAHLEEDAGKNVHEPAMGSGVDLNRAGTPLLEIVTEPDLHSSEEVVVYLKALRELLMYLGVCDGNMEEGSLRCEPNLSLRPVGQKAFGTKVELKNINSFKFVKDAVEFEIQRQTKVLREGGQVRQETRLWNIDRGETAVMRSKEDAHDYRYFPDPDLVPVAMTDEWIEQLRPTVPELPSVRRHRFVKDYRLTEYDAGVLTADKDTADLFEETIAKQQESIGLSREVLGKETGNWIMVEVLALLKKGMQSGDQTAEDSLAIADNPLSPPKLAELLLLKRKGEISGPTAKSVLEEMFRTGRTAAEIVATKGLTQVSDESVLEKILDEVLVKNPVQVEQYKGGKQQVLGFLVGQVMKESGGKANPGKVNELLKRRLSS